MQTRLRAAREAALAQAAAQVAANASPPPANDQPLPRTLSFGSPLSSLTPTPPLTVEIPAAAPPGHTLSFESSLSTLTESSFGGEESDGEVESVIPGLPRRRRCLQTPVHSISNVNSYQAEVQRTPRKTFYRPTEGQIRAAELARDSELVANGPLVRLTREGTMLVGIPESDPFLAPSSSHERGDHGLGSPFSNPTAPPARRRNLGSPIKESPSGTFSVNPSTGS